MKTRNMLSLIMLALLAGVSVARSEIMDAVNMYQGNSVTGFNYVAASGNFTNATTTQTGDYDFDGTSDDRRTYQGITTVLGTALGNPFASGAASNRTSVVRGGFQTTVMNNSTTNPVFATRRITEGTSINGDLISLGSGASSDPMRMASAVNVAKEDFLNGADSASALSFDDAVNMKARVATMTASSIARFLVQNGSDWYISAYSVSAAADMSANGYTQTWYSYDPSSNLLYDNSNLGTGVAGRDLTDIQAFGVIGQSTADVAGGAANTIQFAVSKLSLSVIPEPATIGMLGLGAVAVLVARRMRQ